MADTFLHETAGKVLEKLFSRAFEEVRLAWGMENELRKLKDNSSTFQARVLDAEKAAKTEQLSDWLGKVKEALNDADDLVDEFQCEALRNQVVNAGSNNRKVRNFFSSSNPLAFRLKMGHKIKEISERFAEIAAGNNFHLPVQPEGERVEHREREVTHSFENESFVIGRNIEKETIVRFLMCPSDGENVSIIPIVGIGGMGKTTLARLVCNDDRVKRHFGLKMWVQVPKDFDVPKLTKEILKSAINKNCDGLTNDQSQDNLRRSLDKTHFLLILDDLWNEDRREWIKLIGLLKDGARGSKIIVTTRYESVVSTMDSIFYKHELKGLPPEDCVSLFKKYAFKKGEEKKHPKLLKMVDEIVKKCLGVPLAVITLGSLLHENDNENFWRSVKDNQIGKFDQKDKEILPVLKLSYNAFSADLKQCFAFCSVFPKNYQFSSVELIQFWMALDLLKSSSGMEDLEDVGQQRINMLRSRSFLLDVEDHHYFLRFKMHDLIHDLAELVARTDFFAINSHTHKKSKSLRHASFCDKTSSLDEVQNFLNYFFPEKNNPSFLPNPHNVRTILFPVREVVPPESFVKKLISKFKYLRVLNLSDSDFEVLPSSIGNLKHLRYLNLSRNRSIKKLPSSICKLQSLQTLGLIQCDELQQLPRDIGSLISLRCLSLTTKQTQIFLPEEGMGSLVYLQILWISGCENLKSFGDGMQRLTALRTLIIIDCESLESLPDGMKDLTKLETLVIADCEKLNLEWEGSTQSLRSLSIGHLPQLVALPTWIEGAADTLQHLRIGDCRNLTTLPEWLQSFTLLQKLVIENCPKLLALPENMHCCKALTELKIEYCPILRKRCRPEVGEDWHKISHVDQITLIGNTSEEREAGESSNG